MCGCFRGHVWVGSGAMCRCVPGPCAGGLWGHAWIGSEALPPPSPPTPPLQPVGQRKESGASVKHMPAHGPVVPQHCPETGSSFLMGGPLWAEPLHDMTFVAGLLEELDRDKDRCGAPTQLCTSLGGTHATMYFSVRGKGGTRHPLGRLRCG